MSGGSFNYLYGRQFPEIFDYLHDLEDMVKFLSERGYARDAAREADELLLMLRSIQVRAETRMQRMSSVFKSAEWWQSADTNEDRFKEELARYRGEAASG